MKNYYTILEVEPTATIDQIKTQYRFLLHAWHPDKFPNEELKTKAGEKLKEINEAYSILCDPTKREIYDHILHSYSPSPPPEQQSHSKPTQDNQSHKKPKRCCDNCHLPAETKYIEFYENVGMLFMRKHRSVKGNLCKFCINYYFWNLTGKTMLLGWWGTISFIVTPFILLNNLLRFIFSSGMKKPPVKIVPEPSLFWLFSAVSGFLLIGIYLFSIFSSAFTPSIYSSFPTTVPISAHVPTKVKTATTTKPTRVPTKVKTPTVTSNCIYWEEVTTALIGEEVCVYGNVYKTRFVGESTYQILFSSDEHSFFLAAGRYYYVVDPGDCVAAEGKVLKSSVGVPYIDINDALYLCEPWME